MKILISILMFVLMICILLVLIITIFLLTFDPCDTIILNQVTSPNNKYIARVISRECGATVPSIRIVNLSLANKEYKIGKENDVLFIYYDKDIQFNWINNNFAKIKYGGGGRDAIKKNSWRDVEILFE